MAESEHRILGDAKESLRPGGVQNKKRLEEQKPDFARLRGHLITGEEMATRVYSLALTVCSDP